MSELMRMIRMIEVRRIIAALLGRSLSHSTLKHSVMPLKTSSYGWSRPGVLQPPRYIQQERVLRYKPCRI
jgi:hypothetical protein